MAQGCKRAVAGMATLILVLVLQAPASAAVNGFAGGDGDQIADCAASPIDWQCLADARVLTGADVAGVGDDVFTEGSKGDEPDGWALTSGEVQDKADVESVWAAVVRDASDRNYLYLAAKRVADAGDTFLGVELNQSDVRWTNAAGTTIPCRSDGDVLISYEVSNPPVIRLYEWSGSGGPAACPDGRSGSFGSEIAMPAAGREAALNTAGPIQNFLDVPRLGNSFGTQTFAEAVLDLQTLADAVDFIAPCQYFRVAQVNTRSSSSPSSALKDHVAATDLIARACQTPPSGGGGGGVVAPAAPTIGHTPAGTLLNTNDVTITGTAQPGTTVTVYDDGVPVGFAPVAADGSWSLLMPDLADGDHVFTAQATDNTSGLSSGLSPEDAFTIDTGAPAAPDTGSTVGGNDVTLTCTTEPGAIVRFYEGETLLGTVTADGAGSAQLVLTDVAEGAHSYTCAATDAAGNESEPSAPEDVTVDTVAPAVPQLQADVSGDSVTLTCVTEPGATVQFLEGETVVGTVVAGANGQAQLVLSGVADGEHTYTCRATDAAGNGPTGSEPVSVTVDTVAPGTPTLEIVHDGNDVTLTCTAEPGSSVSFYDGETLLGTVTADGAGSAQLVLTDVAEGTHVYTCTATDDAGNGSEGSEPDTVTVDTTPPAAPTDGASAVGSTVTVTCTTEPGAAVTFFEGTTVVGTAVADQEGVATLVLQNVPAGVHTYTCVATDAAGNVSPPSDGATVTVPSAPADPGTPGTPETPTTNVTPTTSVTPPAASRTTTTTAAPIAAEETVKEQLVDMIALGNKAAACYPNAFTAYVRVKGARRVVFKVDGRKLKTVRRPDRRNQYKVRIVPKRYAPGMHKLTARIKYRKRSRRARTVTLRWRRCVDKCVSRRSFRIRVKRVTGETIKKATVWVNGKRVKVIRGKRLRAPVHLTGLPKGTFKVRILAVTNTGRVLRDTRKYRTCTPKRRRSPRRR